MKTRTMLLMVSVLLAVTVQARHPTLTRLATPGNPTFDLVISYEGNPDGDNDGKTQDAGNPSTQDKIEQIIQYFADCVYESTEGAHQLRTVRIFTNKRNENKCDIQWNLFRDREDRISTHRSIGNNGYIAFGDVYKDVVEYLTNQELGGYTLGHEWGHYAYSLYDEYTNSRGKHLKDVNPNFIVTPSLMAQGNTMAVGGNYQHLNFSVRHRGGNATAGFGPYENTRETRQHAVYGESC